MNFEKFLDLFKLTHGFASIERSVKIQNRKAWETNPEHSYQLALLGWYIADVLGLDLDRKKILEYAIVHDLVEVYAGDTDPHKHSKEFIASKVERERTALEKIKREFSKFSSLSAAIQQFEKLEDDEAKFIYLLDKIVPVINTYISHQDYYNANNVTYQKWQEWLEEKKKKANYMNAEFNKLLDEVSRFFGKVGQGFFK